MIRLRARPQEETHESSTGQLAYSMELLRDCLRAQPRGHLATSSSATPSKRKNHQTEPASAAKPSASKKKKSSKKHDDE
jgi:hypothetical protein